MGTSIDADGYFKMKYAPQTQSQSDSINREVMKDVDGQLAEAVTEDTKKTKQ